MGTLVLISFQAKCLHRGEWLSLLYNDLDGGHSPTENGTCMNAVDT